MAKKPVSRFVCSNCGAVTSSWAGRCSQCGEWNTLEEEAVITTVPGGHSSGNILKTESVEALAKQNLPRLKTKIAEIDDVFGGGIVAGSVNLLAGQPGLGKST